MICVDDSVVLHAESKWCLLDMRSCCCGDAADWAIPGSRNVDTEFGKRFACCSVDEEPFSGATTQHNKTENIQALTVSLVFLLGQADSQPGNLS